MTRIIERPEVFLVAQPTLNWDAVYDYLTKVGERTNTDSES